MSGCDFWMLRVNFLLIVLHVPCGFQLFFWKQVSSYKIVCFFHWIEDQSDVFIIVIQYFGCLAVWEYSLWNEKHNYRNGNFMSVLIAFGCGWVAWRWRGPILPFHAPLTELTKGTVFRFVSSRNSSAPVPSLSGMSNLKNCRYWRIAVTVSSEKLQDQVSVAANLLPTSVVHRKLLLWIPSNNRGNV